MPPVVYSPGSIPSQAANSRPFLKAVPLPIAAMIAVAVTDPRNRNQSSAGFILSSRLFDHRIGFADPHLQVRRNLRARLLSWTPNLADSGDTRLRLPRAAGFLGEQVAGQGISSRPRSSADLAEFTNAALAFQVLAVT